MTPLTEQYILRPSIKESGCTSRMFDHGCMSLVTKGKTSNGRVVRSDSRRGVIDGRFATNLEET